MLTLNESNYKEKIKSGRFIIDVWQDGCGDCQKYSPIFRAAEKLLGDGTMRFANFKVDRNGSSNFRRDFLTFAKGEHAASPTTIIVEDGKMVRRIAGYVPMVQLEEFITNGIPKSLSTYKKEELEAMAFRSMQSMEMFAALQEDAAIYLGKLNAEIGECDERPAPQEKKPDPAVETTAATTEKKEEAPVQEGERKAE